MAQTMKAGVLHAREDIRYETVDMPQVEPGTVRVKVKYTGICGSDVPRVNGDAAHYYPIILGHEFSGYVDETAPDVTSVKKGDRVAGVPLIPCMKCPDCQKGNYSLCKHYSFVGSRQNGSFAEYVVVPESNVVPFGEKVSMEQGALLEPATIALHGLERTGYKGGGTVAILGGGTIGLLTMQWAKVFGASKVVAFDIVKERLDLAVSLGADAGVNTLDEDFMEQVKELTDGKGFDYVYETAGNVITMRMAFDLAANKAGVCFIGTPTRDLVFSPGDLEKMHRKEFTLTGSWMSYSAPFPGHEWTESVKFFESGRIKTPDSFVFKKVPLSQIDQAFAWYRTPGTVKGKILIDSEC